MAYKTFCNCNYLIVIVYSSNNCSFYVSSFIADIIINPLFILLSVCSSSMKFCLEKDNKNQRPNYDVTIRNIQIIRVVKGWHQLISMTGYLDVMKCKQILQYYHSNILEKIVSKKYIRKAKRLLTVLLMVVFSDMGLAK